MLPWYNEKARCQSHLLVKLAGKMFTVVVLCCAMKIANGLEYAISKLVLASLLKRLFVPILWNENEISFTCKVNHIHMNVCAPGAHFWRRFCSHILNMNRGFLHTRSFRRIAFPCLDADRQKRLYVPEKFPGLWRNGPQVSLWKRGLGQFGNGPLRSIVEKRVAKLSLRLFREVATSYFSLWKVLKQEKSSLG